MTIRIWFESGFESGDQMPSSTHVVGAHSNRIMTEGQSADGIGPAPAPMQGSRMRRYLSISSDPQVASGYRAEDLFGVSVNTEARAELWWGYLFTTYFPTGWRLGTTGWTIPWQIHAGSGQPAFNLENNSNPTSFQVMRRRGTNTTKSSEATVTVPADEWVWWALIARWRISNDGMIKLYQSGELIVDIAGQRTNPVSSYGLYPKQGIYRTASAQAYRYGDPTKIISSDVPDFEAMLASLTEPLDLGGDPEPPPQSHLPNPSEALSTYSALVTSGDDFQRFMRQGAN